MEVQGLCSDIITTLPREITERILTLLPFRDALRTSILSRKWRYCWASIPVVIYDDKLFEGSSYSKRIMKHKRANAIFQVLLLRTSPLVDFTLHIKLEMDYEIDQIILYLSRSNTLKSFRLENRLPNHYKLPSSFFSLLELQRIDLSTCDYKPPLMFNGFCKLTSVRLFNVRITSNMLMHLLTNCPLINVLKLIGYQNDITRGNKFTFVELFDCLPSIVHMSISKCYMEFFSAGFMPHKLRNPIFHIRSLSLGVSFMDEKEVSSTICLIKNSPNLVKIYIALVVRPTIMNFLHLQDYPDFKLDHLEEMDMVNFTNFDIEMEFVKHVLAKSSVLKKVKLELKADMSIDEECRMFRNLICLPLPRASPSAKFIIEREISSS